MPTSEHASDVFGGNGFTGQEQAERRARRSANNSQGESAVQPALAPVFQG
jgi:hypothetical protein